MHRELGISVTSRANTTNLGDSEDSKNTDRKLLLLAVA